MPKEELTITMRKVNQILRDCELNGDQPPLARLVAHISIMRSTIQQEIATNEGVSASVEEFKKQYGAVTTETVDDFVSRFDKSLDLPIPYSYVDDVLSAD